MRIFLDNVNLESTSGPNSFAKKMSGELRKEHEVYTSINDLIDEKKRPDVQLSFISSNYQLAPIVQRLDGIYFNSEQDFNELNLPIEATYQTASAVIFQSDFNKKLTEKYFGKKENSFVIRNGTSLKKISDAPEINHTMIDDFEDVWMCASSWRPHKRLQENISYFLENSKKKDCLIIAGENPDVRVADPRVFYAGHLSWIDMISIMKRSSYFLHLAWLDHCPNVVIDARAAGCHIICSSTGGTKEIAGLRSTIILEDDWDYSPVKLYEPPKMNFNQKIENTFESDIEIENVTQEYVSVFESVKI